VSASFTPRAVPVGGRGTIALVDFSFWYGARLALDGVTLVAPPRAVTALVGPSGSGKTTLLRSVNRLNDAEPGARWRGSVELGGEDVYSPRTSVVALRRRVAMVFQRWNPFPKSVYDNVAYGPRLGGAPGREELDRVVEGALRRVALWNEVKDRLRGSALALSGGQQQRLCIARALANEPEALLLDEPASALDPAATQRIEELLVELKSELTIVIVTHNLQQAARVSDYTAFLDAGRVVECDATRRLFTAPREARTEAYLTGRFG